MRNLSGKWAGENPLNVGLPKAKAKRHMYYCSSNEHIMQSKHSKHLSNHMEKKILHCLKSNRKNRRNRDKIDITNTHIHDQSLPRVVGPYTLSNLCQRLKSSLPLF
jgi:hypothetical protein